MVSNQRQYIILNKFYIIVLILIYVKQTVSLISPSTYPSYLGCFYESREPYNKFGDIKVDGRNDFSIEECQLECGCNQNKKFAGLIYGGRCYCDDNDYTQYLKACHEDLCSTPCNSNSLTNNQDVCGGRRQIQIHNSKGCPAPPPVDPPSGGDDDIGGDDDEGNTGGGTPPPSLPPPLCLPMPLLNQCNPNIDTQGCFDILGDLDAEKIENECEDYIHIDGDQYYKFNVTYTNGWEFNKDCFAQTIQIEGTDIPYLYYNDQNQITDGDNIYPILPNQMSLYHQDTHSLIFNIKHSDLVNLGCEYIETTTEYQWQCEFSLNIYFQGVSQLQYDFCMNVRMERQTQAVIDAGVFRNVVEGECCVNELGISSEITFCEEYACNIRITDPSPIFERLQDMYIEHNITTTEFQHYYMETLQVKFGPFLVDIVKYDGTHPGRIILHVIPNIALDNLIIEVISKIHDDPFPGSTTGERRRQLQFFDGNGQQYQGDLRNDYKINAHNQITIKDEISVSEQNSNNSNNLKKNKNQQKSQLSQESLIIIIGGTILTLIGLVFLFVCLYFKYQSKKSNNNLQEKENNLNNQNQQQNKNTAIIETNSNNQNAINKYIIHESQTTSSNINNNNENTQSELKRSSLTKKINTIRRESINPIISQNDNDSSGSQE